MRELRNIVIRLITKYPGSTVTAEQVQAELEMPTELPAAGAANDDGDRVDQAMLNGDFDLDLRLRQWEEHYINAALRLSDSNLSKAARLLGINRTTLYSRIQRLSKEGE